jgi:hypothetical protein
MRPPKPTPPTSAGRKKLQVKQREDKRWSFSFKFWQQTTHFGVAQEEKSWFVSLLGALGQLNHLKIEEVQDEGELSDHWRYHPINWTMNNVPISKSDLDWLPKDYAENAEEFPISQFQISKTKGRVIGFFDEQWIFQIVLLDPMHNIQPSKDFNYRVRQTNVLKDDFTSVCEAVERARHKATCGHDCPVVSELAASVATVNQMSLLYFKVSEQAVIAARALMAEQLVENHGQIYEWGINYVEAQAKEISPPADAVTISQAAD